MLDALKRILTLCIGAAAVVRGVIHRRHTRSSPQAATLLRELANEKSATVPDLSARAKVTQPAALAILIELEEEGLVRLTADKGAEHVRLAAITEAGRQEIGRLH